LVVIEYRLHTPQFSTGSIIAHAPAQKGENLLRATPTARSHGAATSGADALRGCALDRSSSRELLDLLVERVAGLPVLLLVTFRLEFLPPWTGQAHVTVLVLKRLDRREGATLVQRVGGAEALPGDVVAEIVKRTDRVPLFVEEMTKAMLEGSNAGTALSRAGATAPHVPATLQTSLMARLDRVGSAAREVAQVGAALGREFSYELLAAVAQQNAAELDAALDQLVATGLAFRRGAPPQATFLFKHALVQDAAYGTLLRGSGRSCTGALPMCWRNSGPRLLGHNPRFLLVTIRRRGGQNGGQDLIGDGYGARKRQSR
jgi:hypothetical protein